MSTPPPDVMATQDLDEHGGHGADASTHSVSAETRIARCERGQCSRSPGKPTLWMDVDEYERRSTAAQSHSRLSSSPKTTKQPFCLFKPKKQPFRLFDLPLELRNRIYEFAFSPNKPRKYSSDPRDWSPLIHVAYDAHVNHFAEPYDLMNRVLGTSVDERWWAGEPALTRVSYIMRQETLPIYYAQKTVVFHLLGHDWFAHSYDKQDITPLGYCHLFSREKLSLCRSVEFASCSWWLDGPCEFLAEWTDDPDYLLRDEWLIQMLEAVEHTGLEWDAINLPVDFMLNPHAGRPQLVRFEHPRLGFTRTATQAAFDKSYASANKAQYIKLAPTGSIKTTGRKKQNTFIDDTRMSMSKVLEAIAEFAQEKALIMAGSV